MSIITWYFSSIKFSITFSSKSLELTLIYFGCLADFELTNALYESFLNLEIEYVSLNIGLSFITGIISIVSVVPVKPIHVVYKLGFNISIKDVLVNKWIYVILSKINLFKYNLITLILLSLVPI